MAKTSVKTVATADNGFKLPRYLMLAKGAMWLDINGENASGVKLYAGTTKFVGRGKVNEDKKLHPMDLKAAMAIKINEILKPAREHFAKPEIKKLKEGMDKLLITR
jgi:hypothetical protein